MYLGAYNACLVDKPLGEALDMIAGLGLTSAEINSGGFLPPIHLPVDELRASEDAREEYLGEFLPRTDPHRAQLQRQPAPPGRGFPHAKDLIDSIELAALLGVKRVITMSGAPPGGPSGHDRGVEPAAVVEPLPRRAGPPVERRRPLLEGRPRARCGRRRQGRHRDAPRQHRLQPAPMHRLAEEINATHVGAEMDPSHLFWQGIDPVLAVADLGELVYIAAAKDTRINEAAKVNGVIDDRFTAVAEGEPGYLPLGGGTTLSGWPKNPSWDFVAVGRGHDTAYWTEFLRALHKVDPDMPVNIEHEDQELDQMEGLRFAANTLLEAEKAI